tara:strand:- start:1007 stop:3739 length:2733 start_codon:yes stop_codon:yes gene_type:complete
VSGRIVDVARNAIAGAQICAVSLGDDFVSEDQLAPNCVLADAQGRFRFASLWVGRHSMEATAHGFLPSNAIEGAERVQDGAELALADGESKDDLVIVLQPGGVELVGEVTDVGGGPIAGAWVELHPTSSSNSASARAMSNAEGKVALWLGEGAYSAVASAEGYVSYGMELMVPGMAMHVSLVPASTLRGRVVFGDDERPAAHAKVEAAQENGRSYTARADGNGEFAFTRLQAGRYQVSAATEGARGDAPRSVLVSLGQDVDAVLVTLRSAAIVEGKVVEEKEEKPCEDASGLLTTTDRKRISSKSGVGDGRIRFDAVAPGTYSLFVRCGRNSSSVDKGETEIGSEDILDKTWMVDIGHRLRVTVHNDAGSAVANARVLVGSTTRQSFSGGAGRTDHEGLVTIRSVPLGAVTVRVVAEGLVMKAETHELDITGDDQEATVVMTAGGAISGRIETRSGELPKGLVVEARAAGKNASLASRGDANVLDDGSFRIDGLAAGTYGLKVRPERWSFKSLATKNEKKYEVDLGSEASARLVIAAHTGSVQGRVVDSRGNAIVDAFVRIASDPGDELTGIASMQLHNSYFGKDASLTDTEGRFAVEGLPEGPYVVRAYRRGGGEATEHSVENGSDVTLTIVDTGSIRGTVLLPSGQAATNYTIHCANTSTMFSREESVRDASGKFVLEGLPPGRYMLSIKANAGTAITGEIALAANGLADGVTLSLRANGVVTGRVVSLEDGSPVEGIHVTVRSTKGELFGGSDVSYKGTKADGRFEIKAVPAGPVSIWGFTPGLRGDVGEWGPVSGRAEMTEGGRVDVGDLLVGKVRTSRDDAGDLGFRTTRSKDEDAKLVVKEVTAEGPARAAGLASGDVIINVDGHDVRGNNAHLFYTLGLVPVGATIHLTIEGGKELSITAVAR